VTPQEAVAVRLSPAQGAAAEVTRPARPKANRKAPTGSQRRITAQERGYPVWGLMDESGHGNTGITSFSPSPHARPLVKQPRRHTGSPSPR
jgi:hypothetical protein